MSPHVQRKSDNGRGGGEEGGEEYVSVVTKGISKEVAGADGC